MHKNMSHYNPQDFTEEIPDSSQITAHIHPPWRNITLWLLESPCGQ